MIEEIINLLVIAGIGTIGTDLFIGELPIEPNDCLSAIHSFSPSPNKTLDVFEQDIEFWSRNSKSNLAYSKLIEIQTLLHRKSNYKAGDYHVYFSNSLSGIDDNDRDINRNKLYKLSMRFIYRPDSLTS